MRIALWNANGQAQHKFELEVFLKQQQIDVMLMSQTHFTDKNYLKIHGYNFYHTQHPSGKAHGGTGIIIKSNIKHAQFPSGHPFKYFLHLNFRDRTRTSAFLYNVYWPIVTLHVCVFHNKQ